MNKNIVIALVAGLLGGMATRYISPSTAFAQSQTPATKDVRAQSFVLVDQSDQTVGTFTTEPVPGTVTKILRVPGPDGQQNAPIVQRTMRIVLRDRKGRELWSAGGSVTQPLSER
jgi:hypothetical protein